MLHAGGSELRVNETLIITKTPTLNQRHSCSSGACCAQEAGLCEQQRAFDFFDQDRDSRLTVDDFSWAMEHLGLTGEGTVGLTKARRMILAYRVCSCEIMMLALCIVQSDPTVRVCHGVALWEH